ncbi:HlyD family secretion protein [Thalassotalea hakodatensis]|uniref:HlyD family secretion protein n=1 Tax=Thalassotalea hakodatensis TaxID=3030492 RepID=UPI0025728A50|nr:HlyD family secretion protein [Thalassotalea hakodatensis]
MRCLILFLTLMASHVIAQESMLLSGRVKANESQVFYSPKTDNWRSQVQWMLPEGEVAKEGDVVVVFDSGSILSNIEQAETNLIVAEDELHRVTSEATQNLLEAQHQVKRTALLLEKAKIDASVGKQFISQFDYEKNQLDYEKALIAHAKAKDNLVQVNITNEVNVTKKKLTIEKHQRSLSYNQYKLKQMSLNAEREGPVIYGSHPWNGEKVFVGMTAQPSWKIAEIPSSKGMFIEAWLHEVDYKKVSKGSTGKLIFDAYPQHQFTTSLLNISTQPEVRKEWGEDVYYRLKFELAEKPKFILLPGMSVQIALAGEKS